MKIGFSILSHKNPDQLFGELIQQLAVYPEYSIAIHHDFNQASFDKSIVANANVRFVQDYVKTEWSHANNIDAILKTFELLYDDQCDWFVTMSANCYPIKKYTHVIEFLTNSLFDGYIECNDVNTDFFDFYTYFRKAFQTKYLFRIPFMKKNGVPYMKAIRIKRNPSEIIFNNSYIPFHGSDWFMINRTSMEYILNNKTHIHKIVSFFKEVNKGFDMNVCPSEVVFQTLLANNNSLNLSNKSYRYIDWTNSKTWHPNFLNMTHYEALQKTDALFARKLDSDHSTELMHQINKNMLA